MYKFLGVIFSVFVSSQLFAQYKAITIAAPHITSLIEDNGQGYYQKILDEAISEIGNKAQIVQKFYPYKRAFLLFKKKQVDCVYSFTNVAEEALGKENIISSYPLGSFAYYVFTLKENTLPASLDLLIDKRVGAVIGHDFYYKDYLDPAIKLSMVDSDLANLKLLELGRLDYLIAAIPDMLPYLGKIHYEQDKPLVKSFDRITCHSNKKNTDFLKKLSDVLLVLKNSGRYETLGPELYVEFDKISGH